MVTKIVGFIMIMKWKVGLGRGGYLLVFGIG